MPDTFDIDQLNEDLRKEAARKQDIINYIRGMGRIKNIQGLLSTRRGHFANELGDRADEAINAANEELAKLAGIEPGEASSISDTDISSRIQLYQEGERSRREVQTETDKQAEILKQKGIERKKLITELAGKQRGDVEKYAGEFAGKARTYREQLAQRLADLNKRQFESERPDILEDLQRRGLASSETTVASEMAEALKDLELQRERTLTGFETDTFSQEQDLRGQGLNIALTGEQAALNAGLGADDEAINTLFSGGNTALEAVINARRTGIERSFQLQDLAASQAAQDALGRKARRAGVTNALIQGGAGILSAGAGNWGPLLQAVGTGATTLQNSRTGYSPSYSQYSAGSSFAPFRFNSMESNPFPQGTRRPMRSYYAR